MTKKQKEMLSDLEHHEQRYATLTATEESKKQNAFLIESYKRIITQLKGELKSKEQ
jgi:hypothetical protein